MSALPPGVIKQHRLPEYVMEQNFAFFQILQYSLLDHLNISVILLFLIISVLLCNNE